MPLILGRLFVDAFLGQHTSALDHAVVEISSPELLDAVRPPVAEASRKPTITTPGGTPSRMTNLGLF